MSTRTPVPKIGIALCATAICAAPFAHAQGAGDEATRPDENAMFGSPSTPATPPSTTAAPPSTTATAPAAPGAPAEPPAKEKSKDAFASGDVVDNPLTIGAKYYQRLLLSGQSGGGASGAPISAPLQFDGFLDGRPNDRLRAFVDARLFYDPTRDAYSNSTAPSSQGSLQFSSGSTAPTSLGATPVLVPNNPQVSLDQVWLKFDVDHTVFATVGKQHVKWGTSRFWNPTDFLHTQRRDPLLPYDQRLGNTMAKFELPVERYHANVSAIALLDNPQPASSLGQTGLALRAEKVWGELEAGLDFVVRGNQQPVYGADASASLGPFDVYFEGALLTSPPSPQYQVNTSLTLGADISALAVPLPTTGPYGQISGGLNYDFGWKENRQATLGFEYFYNQAGYSDATVYPALIFFGQYQPFYTGRHYAAVYLTAEGPDELKRTNYTFTTLGNLSDGSYISRLDFSWRVLTYLTFESYADVHYGTQGGEFNFTLSTPTLSYQGKTIQAINIPPTIFDVGLGLRMDL